MRHEYRLRVSEEMRNFDDANRSTSGIHRHLYISALLEVSFSFIPDRRAIENRWSFARID